MTQPAYTDADGQAWWWRGYDGQWQPGPPPHVAEWLRQSAANPRPTRPDDIDRLRARAQGLSRARGDRLMHPYLLHAVAACWSLEAARTHLAARARVEAEQIAAEQAETAHDGIRSTVYGVRSGNGSHGDPAAATALLGVDRPPRVNRFQLLAESTTDTLTWLAHQLQVPGLGSGGDPLGLLRAHIPHLLPGTAATVHRWLAEADQRIRQPLQLRPDWWALPGNPECPACRQRLLYVQTSAPSSDWTVICAAGCVCTGEACPCGMRVRVEGVGHIWDRTAAIVAQALA